MTSVSEVLEKARQLVGRNDLHGSLATLLVFKKEIAGEKSKALGVLDARIQPLLKELSQNSYTALGITRTATESEVKKSYRQLALKYHPDKCSATTELFHCIQNAYDRILNNAAEVPTSTTTESSFAAKYKQTKEKNDAKTRKNSKKDFTTPLQMPRNLRVTESSTTSITVAWEPPQGVNGQASQNISCYELQFKTETDTKWTVASSTIRGTMCQKHNLTATSQYRFKVRALHSLTGEWSPFGSSICAGTMSSVPSRLCFKQIKFMSNQSSFELSWEPIDNQSDKISYVLEWRVKKPQEGWKKVATEDVFESYKCTRVVDTIPSANTVQSNAVQFRVRGCNQQGPGPWSDIKSLDDKETNPPKVKIISTKPVRRGVRHMWLPTWGTWDSNLG